MKEYAELVYYYSHSLCRVGWHNWRRGVALTRMQVTRIVQRIVFYDFFSLVFLFSNHICAGRLVVRIWCNCEMRKMDMNFLFRCVQLMPIVLLVLTLYDRCTLSKQQHTHTPHTAIQMRRKSRTKKRNGESTQFFPVFISLFRCQFALNVLFTNDRATEWSIFRKLLAELASMTAAWKQRSRSHRWIKIMPL